MTRTYDIEDDGEAVQVALFEDDMQMGGAYFPWKDIDGYNGEAFSMAQEVANDWLGVQPTYH